MLAQRRVAFCAAIMMTSLAMAVLGTRAEAQSSAAIAPDPAIHTGVLANGLRYAILQNTRAGDALSVRLGVEVGSSDESDGERGVAHFLEHMAFSVGQNDHIAGYERAFAAEGAAFGRDQNAETSQYDTIYRLDLPHDDAPSLSLAFRWLRGVAGQTTFSADAVRRERGIILAERDARHTAQLVAYQAMNRFLAPDLVVTRPDAIGTVKQIDAITPATLAAFYARWYRPDNTVLVVVGPRPVAEMETLVHQTFDDWKTAGPAPSRQSRGTVDEARALSVMVRQEPHLGAEISACRVHAPPPERPLDVARLRAITLSRLWRSILDARFVDLAKSESPPFLAAQAIKNDDPRDFAPVCVALSPIDNHWELGMRAVERELRRFQIFGPTPIELQEAIARERSYYRGDVFSADARKTPDLATLILVKTLRNDVTASPAELSRAFEAGVASVTAKDVTAAFVADWSGAGPLITVLTPRPPSTDIVRASWLAGQEEPPPAAQAVVGDAVWAYSDFGPAGHVAKREEFHDPDFTRYTYSNGVVLNFRHTDSAAGAVRVRVRFGAGRREIPNLDYTKAVLGAALFKLGGLGREDYQDVQRALAQWQWDVNLDVGDDAFTLSGRTFGSGLAAQLQILAAYASDPGFRSSLDARLPSVMDSLYRQYRARPDIVLRAAFADALAPGMDMGIPPEEELQKLHMGDIASLLKPAITQAPLEVTVVGDVGEDTVRTDVADTFGALPPRQSAPRKRDDTLFLRFPDHPLPLVRVTHEGPADQALVGVMWPLYVATPERRREEVALTLLGEVFDNALRHRVRQDLGKSYAPDVGLYSPDHADQAYMQATVLTEPADVDQVLAATRGVARKLAAGDFTDEDVEDARKPILAKLAEEQNSTDRLAAALSGSSIRSDGLDEWREVPKLLATVTPAEIRKAAADWLSHAPLVIEVMPRAATADARN